MRIPWWLSPWQEAGRLRRAAGDCRRQIDGLRIAVQQDKQEIRQLEDRAIDAEARNAELARQLTVQAGPPGASGQHLAGWEEPGLARPEFVMCGVDRGAGRGKRLYASRELGGTAFSMTGMENPPPRFVLSTAMGNALIIDKPGYGEAIEQLMRTWASWAAEQGGLGSSPPRSLPR